MGHPSTVVEDHVISAILGDASLTPPRMSKKSRQREAFLRDVDARQRNVIFPDTAQNEARFWRNLGSAPLNTPAKIGLGIFAVSVIGIIFAVINGLASDNDWQQHLLSIVLGYVLVIGPIFGAIVWATRRALRDIAKTGRKR